MAISPSLEGFAKKLLEERGGLEGLNPGTVQQMEADLTGRLENRVNAALIENLSPQYLEEAERLVDEGDAGKIQQFFQDHIPNVSDVIASELLMFRQTYLNVV